MDEDDYVNFINKTAYNKRKSIHQKNKKLEHKKDAQEKQSKSPVKFCGTIQPTLKKRHSSDSAQKFPNDLVEKVCQPVHQEQQPSLQSDRFPIPQLQRSEHSSYLPLSSLRFWWTTRPP